MEVVKVFKVAPSNVKEKSKRLATERPKEVRVNMAVRPKETLKSQFLGDFAETPSPLAVQLQDIVVVARVCLRPNRMQGSFSS